MAFPASVYAVPEAPAPKRKPVAVELKKTAVAAAAAESRRKRKIEQAHRVLNKIDQMDADLALRIRELQKRRSSLVQRKERICDRILSEMSAARIEKADGIRVTFSTRLAPASLVVEDEALIPADYLREKLVTSVDKVAIKQAFERGQDVPGCHLEQRVSLVRK